MRDFAAKLGLITFFIMIGLGLVAGQPPMQCAVKGVFGSLIMYFAALLAMRLCVDVMLQSVKEAEARAREAAEHPEEEMEVRDGE
jgi:hypothetical protein